MAVHGVFVVDKQPGLTSFDVVAQVRRAARERRVGHAGTLDPMATGVLLLCLGEATKLVPYLMDADKEYRATARLGVSTDTDDAAPGSRVLQIASAEALQALRPAAVAEALAALVGELVQRPPRFCALKVDGERLYDRARRELDAAGEAALEAELVAKQRPVRVDAIAIEELELGGEAPAVTFTVRCGKGTYIRALARDLGDRLGVGAHLTALRRLRTGGFTVEQACSIEEIGRGAVKPHGLAAALQHLPRLVADAEQTRRLRQGHKPTLSDLAATYPPAGSPVVALDPAGELIAVLEPDGNRWVIGRGFGSPTPPAPPPALPPTAEPSGYA
jgi:tRNA pseudouridine55 synthase